MHAKLNCSKRLKLLLKSYGITIIQVGNYKLHVIKLKLTNYFKSTTHHSNYNICNKELTDKEKIYVTAFLTSLIVLQKSMEPCEKVVGG